MTREDGIGVGEEQPEGKRRFWVKYETQDDADDVARYAKAKKLDVPSFLKFAAQQYMDRYPAKRAARPGAVHPEASGRVFQA